MRVITSIAQLQMIPVDPVRHPHPALVGCLPARAVAPRAAQHVSQVCEGVQQRLAAILDDRDARADW
jgi:hypothetical protein